MNKTLLPTEQAELARASANAIEAQRLLRLSPQLGLKWTLLPAVAIALAVYVLLGDLGTSSALRLLLSVVGFFAASSWIELLLMRKRMAAVEALAQLHLVQARLDGDSR